MGSRARSGPVRVELDADALLAGLREVGAEALAVTIESGQRHLQEVVDAGRPRLPVRSGTLRDSARVLVARKGDAVEVVATSTDQQARYKRFSRYTAAELAQRAQERADGRVAEATAAGRRTLPAATLAARELSRLRRIHGPGAPEGLTGKPAFNAVIGGPARKAVKVILSEVEAAIASAAERA